MIMRPKHTLIVICLALMFLVFSYVNQTTMSTWSAVASALNPRNIAAQPTSINFDVNKGQKIDFVYEAFLSPHQEPGEEKDTPSLTPKQFRSTAPSLLRNERKSRGHGVLRFSNDLSKAYVDVKVENVNPKDVVMFQSKTVSNGACFVNSIQSRNSTDTN
jgi:hypothetical protein